MNVATSRIEVGVRELKNRLSHYVGRVRDGDEIVVTMRGRPVARLASIDPSQDRLAALIEAGIVHAPERSRHPRPLERIRSRGSVSGLVAAQRR